MSERKALFQKNASVPTPIARFGDPVTPAMLSKREVTDGAQGTPLARPAPIRPGSVFAKKPIELPTEAASDSAWKRKREQSPPKRAASPSKLVTPGAAPSRVTSVPSSAPPAPNTRVTSAQPH